MTPDGGGPSRREILVGLAAAAVAIAVPAWWFLARSEDDPDEEASSGGTERGTSDTPAPAGHVILIDWDGFDPDYLERASTPNIDALAARGSLSVAEGVFPTISNPSRASMSTGAYPERHGNAAYYYDEDSGRAVGETRFLNAETISEALAEEGRTTASVQWYMVQDHGASYGDPEHLYVEPGGAFGERVDAAIEVLNQRPVDSGGETITAGKAPDFLAVYGSELDELGHEEGAGSPKIGPLLARMDRDLGRLIQATRDTGIHDDTTFILTSDHGMATWNLPAMEGLAAIARAGYRPEVVLPGRSSSEGTEVVAVIGSRQIADITLLGRAATPEGRSRVREVLENAPHVARVLERKELDELRASDKLGDFVVEVEENYGFALEAPPSGASLGAHASTREMRVPLLLSGAGIQKDAPPRSPGLVDVAPTIAALLGARPPKDAQGRTLTEALAGQGASPGRRDGAKDP